MALRQTQSCDVAAIAQAAVSAGGAAGLKENLPVGDKTDAGTLGGHLHP